MGEVAAWLIGMAPEIVTLISKLFTASGGSVHEARKIMAARTGEYREFESEIDRRLAAIKRGLVEP
jgi:aromatic ring-opening dioxygenase catalytic subunit (LigB family)